MEVSRVEIGDLSMAQAVSIARNMRELDRVEARALCHPGSDDDLSIAARFTINAPTSWCATLNGEPVAMVATGMLWPGVWQVGAFATDRMPEVALPLSRFVRRDVIPAMKAAGAHRAHALSIADHVQSHRWLEMLGAKREGVLERYGRNGEDFIMFAWTS